MHGAEERTSVRCPLFGSLAAMNVRVGGGECACVCDVINLALNFITRCFAL